MGYEYEEKYSFNYFNDNYFLVTACSKQDIPQIENPKSVVGELFYL